jgi:hypothetical protein
MQDSAGKYFQQIGQWLDSPTGFIACSVVILIVVVTLATRSWYLDQHAAEKFDYSPDPHDD